ncbi:MAG: hypothetical protein GEU90_20880 [Gemmatimonas sp.]|nr:hypothetical protein [Gemmatimonas sp.]
MTVRPFFGGDHSGFHWFLSSHERGRSMFMLTLRRAVGLVAVAGVCLGLGVSGAFAQTTAAISGVVEDQAGGVIPGVTVTATNTATGVSRTEVTDGEGRYRLRDLALGTYEVRAELPGFQAGVRRGIELTMGREAVVEFSLGVGDLAEEVIVTGDAPLVDTRSGAVAGRVSEEQIRELPIAGRDITNLVTLEAGVARIQSSGPGGGAHGGYGQRIAIGGSRPDMTGWLVDGTEVQTVFRMGPAGATGEQLGADAVQEFRVSTSSYTAEQGVAGGGVVSAVTKSGTNTIRGSAFEFFRDDALNTKGYFDEDKPPFRRHQFGVSMGGPIVRNRTFYFGAYERLTQSTTETQFADVPTAASRAGILPDGRTVAVDPLIAAIMDLYPLSNGQDLGTGVGEFISLGDQTVDEHFVTARIDHVFNSAHSMYGRLTGGDVSIESPNSVKSLQNFSKSRRFSGSVEETWIISSRWLNRFRFGFSQAPDEVAIEELHDLSAAHLTAFPLPIQLEPRGPSLTNIGVGCCSVMDFDLSHFEFANHLSYAAGPHNVRFGGEFRRMASFEDAPYWPGGRFIFSGLENFLTGQTTSVQGHLAEADGIRDFRQNLIGLYVQDDWRVHPRLSLNAGLRYEFITEPYEVNNRYAVVRTMGDDTWTVGKPFENPSLRNFAPRVNFAWSPTADGRTSVRGGVGLFYDQVMSQYWMFPAVNSPPYGSRGEVTGLPIAQAYPTIAALDPSELTLSLGSLDYYLETPLMTQFNLNLQRQLSDTMAVQIGYMGSRGKDLMNVREGNSALPVILEDGRKFFPAGLERRYPRWAGDRRQQTTGSSEYHALVMNVTKRLSQGFQFGASYTLSKNMDDGTQTFTATIGEGEFASIDPDDLSRNWSLALHDRRHNLVINGLWRLPGQELGGIPGALVGGWQLSGVLAVQSGRPISASLGFNRSRNLATENLFEVPNLKPGASGNPIVDPRDPDAYLDASGFELQPAGFFGNLGRNTIIGPGIVSLDGALSKNFTFWGDRRLTFRIEGFNLLNRANFGQPSGVRRGVLLPTGQPNPSAGRIRGLSTVPRQVQLGVRFTF